MNQIEGRSTHLIVDPTCFFTLAPYKSPYISKSDKNIEVEPFVSFAFWWIGDDDTHSA